MVSGVLIEALSLHLSFLSSASLLACVWLQTMLELQAEFLGSDLDNVDVGSEASEGPGDAAGSVPGEQGASAASVTGFNNRRIPAWGAAIFSPACVCIRPSSPEQLAGFAK
jgi:hypothetical protein